MHSTEIQLQQVTTGNPFADHPQLKGIWHAGLQSHIESDTESDLRMGAADPAKNRIYLILVAAEVVGITGFYQIDVWGAGLRWHGVIPQARTRGVSRAAFALVRLEVLKAYPGVHALIELVEMSDPDAVKLMPYFQSLGFKPVGSPRDARTFKNAVLPEDSGDWLKMEYGLRPTQLCGKGYI